jgi:hypothetical protein
MAQAATALASTALPTGLQVRNGIEASVGEPRRPVLLASSVLSMGCHPPREGSAVVSAQTVANANRPAPTPKLL